MSFSKRSEERKPAVKRKKFDYEAFRVRATNADRAVRKVAFVEYFEQFHEYPSYLFDNEREIDENLWQTAQDILKDVKISKEARTGVDLLLNRLPFRVGTRA